MSKSKVPPFPEDVTCPCPTGFRPVVKGTDFVCNGCGTAVGPKHPSYVALGEWFNASKRPGRKLRGDVPSVRVEAHIPVDALMEIRRRSSNVSGWLRDAALEKLERDAAPAET